MEWGIAIGAIVCLAAISYIKGFDNGFEKKDEDIEKMLDEAIERAKGMK